MGRARRFAQLRRLHERGYRAADVREELKRPLAGLLEIWTRNIDALIDEHGGNRAIRSVLAALYVADHEEVLPVIRNRVHDNTLRRDAQAAALALHGWQPVIPETTFVGATSSLWDDDDLFEEVAA